MQSFAAPGPLAVVQVEFEHPGIGEAFAAPLWFGTEITDERNCDNQAIALHQLGLSVEMPISNEILDAVLDTLEEQQLRSMLGRDDAERSPVSQEAPVTGEACAA